MNHLVLVGMNFRTAPQSLRDHFALSPQALSDVLPQWRVGFDCEEILALSTCNRVEILAVSTNPGQLVERIRTRFFRLPAPTTPPRSNRQLYVYQDSEAVQHVFRVASGLDSMVMGESQILSQASQALKLAAESNAAGPLLNELMRHALRVGRRIRRETALGRSNSSLADVAAELFRSQLAADLRSTILVVGTGKMATLLIFQLRKAGFTHIQALARPTPKTRKWGTDHQVDILDLDSLLHAASQADALFFATSCPTPLLTRSGALAIARLRKTQVPPRLLSIFDLGAPRNVEPNLARIPGLRLISLKDLGAYAAQAHPVSADDLALAENIVRQETHAFERHPPPPPAPSAVGSPRDFYSPTPNA